MTRVVGGTRQVVLRTGEVLFVHDGVIHKVSHRGCARLAYVQAACGVTTGFHDAFAGLTALDDEVRVESLPVHCEECFGV